MNLLIKLTVSNTISQFSEQDSGCGFVRSRFGFVRSLNNVRIFRLGNTFKISQPSRLEAVFHYVACQLKIEKEITDVKQIDNEWKKITNTSCQVKVQKKFEKSCQTIIDRYKDQKIKDICQKLLLISGYSSANTTKAQMHLNYNLFDNPLCNVELAAKIIAASGGNNSHVKKICSGNFLLNPTDHLVHLMIERDVRNSHREEDEARAFVICRIPGFANKLNIDYFKTFAENYFKQNPNQSEIMKVFKSSVRTDVFKESLQDALDRIKNIEDIEERDKPFFDIRAANAERLLREALTIFRQPETLDKYLAPYTVDYQPKLAKSTAELDARLAKCRAELAKQDVDYHAKLAKSDAEYHAMVAKYDTKFAKQDVERAIQESELAKEESKRARQETERLKDKLQLQHAKAELDKLKNALLKRLPPNASRSNNASGTHSLAEDDDEHPFKEIDLS